MVSGAAMIGRAASVSAGGSAASATVSMSQSGIAALAASIPSRAMMFSRQPRAMRAMAPKAERSTGLASAAMSANAITVSGAAANCVGARPGTAGARPPRNPRWRSLSPWSAIERPA